jgi:hypothetical protein
MVPRAEEPPLVPLTAQMTAEFEVPETVAVNWKEAPAGMLAEVGETDTEMEAGGVGAGVVGVGELLEGCDTVAEQPARVKTAENQTTFGNQRMILRTLLGIGCDVTILGWLPRPGHWTKGKKKGKVRMDGNSRMPGPVIPF